MTKAPEPQSSVCCQVPEPAVDQLRVLKPIFLSDGVAVGREPSPQELEQLAAAGFKSVINSRLDNEQGLMMRPAEAEQAARKAGLEYRYVPVEGRNPLDKDVRDFSAAVKALPGPVYAYCRSGGRSSGLWAMMSVANMGTKDIVRTCAEAGFDVAGLSAKMDMRRSMLEDDGEE